MNQTPHSPCIVRLNHIKKTYELGKTQVVALKDINFSLRKGEFTVIMGPSGSGKTTLLNIIGCLDRQTSGDYFLDEQLVEGRDFDDLAAIRNQKIGFIFQSFNLIPVLNVFENIAFPCQISTHNQESKEALKHRITTLAEDVGLLPFIHHRPEELSGGQRQRVAIARALAMQPVLILADEPTANLDSKTSQQIIDLMMKLNQEKNVTFLFSTHDPRVTAHARRVAHIEDGQIIEGT